MSTRVVMALEEWRGKAAAGDTPADVILQKSYVPDQIKADAESRTVTFCISTAVVDREGDSIAVEGWQLDNYRKNPVVLWAHRYDGLPIAKAVSVVTRAGQLKATAEFPPPGVHELADTIFDLLKGGFLRATSVGFRPIKAEQNEERPGYAVDFLEQELLEFSVVSVPCNPEALMDQAKGFAGAMHAGIDLSPIRRALDLAESAIAPLPLVSPVPATKAPEVPAPIDIAIEKQGRRFSAANAKRIQDAYDACMKAADHHGDATEHLKALMDQMDVTTPEDPDEAEEGDDEQERAATPPPEPAPAKKEHTYVLTAEQREASIRNAIARAAVVSAGATTVAGKE